MALCANVTLRGEPGFCNAVRRTLLADVKTWAPRDILVRTNTTHHTDEYLAHRIGMIPFRRVGNGDEMILAAEGACRVRADAFVGPAFEATFPCIEVVTLAATERLEVVVRFDEQLASKHARYASCAGVGMCAHDDACTIRFETIDGRLPRDVFMEALDALDGRVQSALQLLAKQPTVPPRSYC